MIPPTFRCRHCGGDTYVEPDDWSAICADCCGKRGEHEWYYERADRQWLCEHCNELAPPDFAADDEGYGLGSMFIHSERGPVLGTPLSQLSGRPGHPGYEAFKRIAASWGYD